MKGYTELSKENGLDLISRCLHQMDTYKPKKETKTKFSLLKMKKVTLTWLVDVPHWYGYKQALKTKLNSLKVMLNKPDPIHLSLDCYEHLLKLSEGDRRANPVFILNY